MFDFKEIKYPGSSSNQEAKSKLLAEDEVQDDTDEKENWRNKMGLPQTLDINVARRYSHIGENLLHLTFDALGV